MSLECVPCSNTSRFWREQIEREVVEVDGAGEFVKVIDADTKDAGGYHCYFCDDPVSEEGGDEHDVQDLQGDSEHRDQGVGRQAG